MARTDGEADVTLQEMSEDLQVKDKASEEWSSSTGQKNKGKYISQFW